MTHLRKLLAFFHHHKWEPVKTNRYGIVFEQRCRCDAVRHTAIDGFDWNKCETRWIDGPHPSSNTTEVM